MTISLILQKILSRIKHKTVGSMFVRAHEFPMTTHLPILIGTSRIARAASLLELGSGMNSTPYFENQDCFPTVKSVLSYEDDHEWYQKVKSTVSNFQKTELRFVDSISQNVLELITEDHNLIFIDDSDSAEKRQMTIMGALEKAGANSIIVVHDFENRTYQNVVRSPWKSAVFSNWKPYTGVLYQNSELDQHFERLGSLIEKNKSILPLDVAKWSEIFAVFDKAPRNT
jgi:hypothetical protein